MSTLELESKLRSALRAAAHPLRPVVQIGDKGLSDAVVKEIDRALAAHGLIKVAVAGRERAERQAMQGEICAQLDCAPVHHLGKVLILYRPTEDDPHGRKLLGDQAPVPAATLGVQPRKADDPYVPKKVAAEGGTKAPVRRKPQKPARDESELSPRERYLGASARKAVGRKTPAARSGAPVARGSALSLRAGARGPRPGTATRPSPARPRTATARKTSGRK